MTTSQIEELKKLFADGVVLTDQTALAKVSHDASTHPSVLPEAVVMATKTEDVVQVLQFASEHLIPVTTRGRGTSLEGNSIPSQKGIVLDLSSMNRVLEVNPDDFQVEVEPGITGDVLNQELVAHSLFFPAFPASSAIASLGGMIANNAGGMYAVKYGVVGKWVMGLEIVLADGRVINVGSRSIKSAAGYSLKELFLSSEGTLGVITKARLKLLPIVQHRQVFLASFPTVDLALSATQDIILEHIDPAAMELLDQKSVAFINSYKNLAWTEVPTLLMELHGTKEELPILAQKIELITKQHQALTFQVADTEEKMASIWDGRKAVHPAIRARFPDAGILPGDVGLPLSKIPEFMAFLDEITTLHQVESATFGHIGDGNFHFWLVFNRESEVEFKRASLVASLLIERALSLGGTCTAEHGIGIGKKKYLAQEHPDLIELMKEIKSVFDPQGILNPTKIF